MCLCVTEQTHHLGCGCKRLHATLPCPRAFDRSLPKCDYKSYICYKVEGDCPECKLAFDNKSCRIHFSPETETATKTKTRTATATEPKSAPETQMTAPEPDPESEQPKPEIKYTPKLEPNPSHKIHQTSPHNGEKTGSSPTTLEALGYVTIHTFCDDVFSFLGEEICKRILETYHARQAVRKAHKEPAPVIHQGTFAQIDQQHNQLRRFTQKQRQDHKKALCLEWVNDPDEPEAAPAFGESQLPLRPTHGAARVPQAEIVREQRRLNSARRQHKTDKRGRIAPPPVNTPRRIIAPRVVSRPVRDEYTLTARHHLLSAGQRSALHKRGHGSAKRLCVVSRRQNRRTAWAC